jgi:hypothetical protein
MYFLKVFGITSALLAIYICLVTSTTANKESPTKKENVTISKWDYCQGCKEIVQLYALVSSEKLSSMQKRGVEAHQSVEANDIATEICDNHYYKKYQSSMKYSCVKILDENRQSFLTHFQGSTTSSSLLNKADIFMKKKNV